MTDAASGERFTFHLTPEAVWQAQAGGGYYRPEAFAADGFIHCTDGAENLLKIANAFYRDDSRAQVVLVIDVGRITAEVRYEDPERIFPHIYGALNTDAVVALRQTARGPDGAYLGLAEPRAVGAS